MLVSKRVEVKSSIKKFSAIVLTILLLANMVYFGMGKLELVVFWFNIFILGGISYWFFKEKKSK